MPSKGRRKIEVALGPRRDRRLRSTLLRRTLIMKLVWRFGSVAAPDGRSWRSAEQTGENRMKLFAMLLSVAAVWALLFASLPAEAQTAKQSGVKPKSIDVSLPLISGNRRKRWVVRF